MEQITAPSVVTAPSIDGHAPLPKRNGLRTMIPLTWLGRETLVEYMASDGKGVSTSATILYCRGLRIICTIAGAPLIVAWDAIRIVELRVG